MPVEVGQILEGKVTGITKFGAFVALPEGENGLVHISEVSDKYVEDIQDFLQKDDVVKVKVMEIREGKVSLSIRKASVSSVQKQQKPREYKKPQPPMTDKEMTFEDKLSRFMKESNERNDQIRHRENKRQSGHRSRSRNVHA